MHELSIVNSLIELCEENAKNNNANNIKEVHVKIGRLSGVEIELFKRTFETFKEDSLCKNAKLIINLQDVIIKCKDCKEENTLKENVFICPKCEGKDLDIIDGDELYLMRLIMG